MNTGERFNGMRSALLKIAIMEKPSAPSIAPLIVCRIVSQYGTA